MIDRDEHIAGLDLAHLTPADIDYFFGTLADRVPRRVHESRVETLQVLRGRLQQLAVDLGKVTATSLDPADTDATIASLIESVEGMKRRHWRSKIDGRRVLDHVREQVGEISADLREIQA